jgi:OHCU decarboxylase
VPTSFQTDLERLNLLPTRKAENELLKCCGSRNWARQMADGRPFRNLDHLIESANRVWWALKPHDWLEAFHSHPKIGENKAAAATSTEAQKWSEAEQSGTQGSAPETMQALADLNRKYEEKFGYIFIVCATGKSSEEMLEILRERMNNVPEDELRIAAAEQAKITHLRLTKLIA